MKGAHRGLPSARGATSAASSIPVYVLRVLVSCRYDTGPILAQAVVAVSPTDTPKQLAAKVLKEVSGLAAASYGVYNSAEPLRSQVCTQEHRLYPHAVAALVDGRINWRSDGIPVIWTAH